MKINNKTQETIYADDFYSNLWLRRFFLKKIVSQKYTSFPEASKRNDRHPNDLFIQIKRGKLYLFFLIHCIYNYHIINHIGESYNL